MKIAILILLLVGISVAADAPKLSDASKLAIRNAQVETQQIQIQMSQLEKQYKQLGEQGQAAQQKLSEAVKAAYKEAKVTEEDYTLDANLNLVAKSKPEQKPVAKPDEKK